MQLTFTIIYYWFYKIHYQYKWFCGKRHCVDVFFVVIIRFFLFLNKILIIISPFFFKKNSSLLKLYFTNSQKHILHFFFVLNNQPSSNTFTWQLISICCFLCTGYANAGSAVVNFKSSKKITTRPMNNLNATTHFCNSNTYFIRFLNI